MAGCLQPLVSLLAHYALLEGGYCDGMARHTLVRPGLSLFA
jgi:hypothetical protein